ncbi:MAG: VOC family protein [Alphaproteobacteria bacterium]|nr:VOC family protein [Alphaproteobacteria bacterium]
MKISPYLNFDGNCREAFEFYAKVLGGKNLQIMTFRDMPPGQGMPPMTDEQKNMVMHARFSAGDTMIMGSDAPSGRYQKPQGHFVNVSVDQPEEADRIFAALAEGGNVSMPIAETFWAERFGMLTDRFGTPWMLNCEKPM